jgi:signal transduction histidine kinase
VVIESGEVQGRSVQLSGGLRLKATEGSLDIRYTGLSLVKPEQVRFSYRLEGLDSRWVEEARGGRHSTHTCRRDALFSGDRGQQRLGMERAGRGIGDRGPGAVAATWRAWRRRIAQLERAHATQLAFSRQLIESQETERKRMAGELHDSLGQHLLVIRNRAAMGLRRGNDSAQAREQLEEIAASASQPSTRYARLPTTCAR